MKPRCPTRGMYAITDCGCPDFLEKTRVLLQGGIAMLQYRDKRGPNLETARALRDLCLEFGCPFLVNDVPELARQAQADGVHLGRQDMPPAQARQCLGSQAIIGVSCYDDMRRAQAAAAAGADYVAVGSFHPSASKPEAVIAPPALLRRLRAELPLPIVAIGGITPENGQGLLDSGASLLACVSGLYRHEDPGTQLRRYNALFASGA